MTTQVCNGRESLRAGAMDILSGATLLLRSYRITNNIAGGSYEAFARSGLACAPAAPESSSPEVRSST